MPKTVFILFIVNIFIITIKREKKLPIHTSSFFTFIDITQFSSWKMSCVSFPLANVPCIRALQYFFITCALRICLYQICIIKAIRSSHPSLNENVCYTRAVATWKSYILYPKPPLCQSFSIKAKMCFGAFGRNAQTLGWE